MSLNYLEIDKIISELDLEGSHLQKVKPVDYESFLFSFYKPGNPTNVFISLDKNCRIHRQTQKTTKLGKPHNLVEFLKAYLVGGKVIQARQNCNNRIIMLEILNGGITYYLFIRLWGGFSNIIITSKTMEILHLHKKSSKKNELPGKTLTLPPENSSGKQYVLNSHNYDDYNSYIEHEYLKILEGEKKLREEKKKEVLRNRRVKELNRQLKKLNRRLDGYLKADTYKLYADLILSNMHSIQKGDLFLEAVDYSTGKMEKIPLNPELEPHKNSDIYYKKNRKAVQGLEQTQNLIKNLISERDNPQVSIPSGVKDEKKADKESKPGLFYNSNGWDILVGRNAKENEALLRSYVKGNDMWLHIRDYPGGYVFIKYKKNRTFPLDVIVDAGILALYYSKGKSNGKADIKYTQVKHLRKIKKGKPGQVIAQNDKNIYVTLDKKRLDALKP